MQVNIFGYATTSEEMVFKDICCTSMCKNIVLADDARCNPHCPWFSQYTPGGNVAYLATNSMFSFYLSMTCIFFFFYSKANQAHLHNLQLHNVCLTTFYT